MEKEEKGKAKAVQIQYYQSPCGKLILGSFENKLCMCDWVVSEERRTTIDKRIQKALNAQYAIENSEVITQTISQLDEYFSRQRTTFDIPLLLIGTEFQTFPTEQRYLMLNYHRDWIILKLSAR